MKTTSSILLFASSILSASATSPPVPSTSSTYTIKIVRGSPQVNGSMVVVKDESAGATFPNPLGSFSTGEPRHAYTVALSPISVADNLYELKSTVKQTHLILNGDPIAPQLFETRIGEDPAPVPEKTVTSSRFIASYVDGKIVVQGAEDEKSASGSFLGAGSWRACNGGTMDYQLYWFDGLSNLTAVAGYCESVGLELVEVVPSASTSIVPATTLITSGWITGVTAPTETPIPDSSSSASGFITGVPAPVRPSSTSATPSSTAFPEITIRIYNDETGANAAATVLADGSSHNISDLFHGTAIDNNGNIVGTSAQLVKFLDSTKCSMVNADVTDWVVELDGCAKNFVDLDRDMSKAIPVWLNGFSFACQV